MAIVYKGPEVTSETKGHWLNILLNGHLHLSIHKPSLLKVQSWANHPSYLKRVIFGQASRYYIETTNKPGVQDLSDYADKVLWSRILKQIQTQISQ